MHDIYIRSTNDYCRYALGINGSNSLITIGLNPSTATKEKSDPTVTRVKKVAKTAGYDGFIMLNLYPVRATDFRELPPQVNNKAFSENLYHIENLISHQCNPTVWATWGESIHFQSYFQEAFIQLHQRLAQYKINWLRFGPITQSGHPRHPSRIKYSWGFFPFNIQDYASTFHATPRKKTLKHFE